MYALHHTVAGDVLVEKDFGILLLPLLKYKEKAIELAKKLKLPEEKVEEISKSRSPETQLTEVINEFLYRKNPQPTMEALATGIRSAIDDEDLIRELESKLEIYKGHRQHITDDKEGS